MPYVPHSPTDIRAMLDVVGKQEIGDLFSHLPGDVRLDRPLDLAPGMTEEEVRRYFRKAAAANHGQDELVSFLGGGVYDSIIPAAIDAISSRSEFLTAYTPYQPEVSQGTLQVIYEWQSFICRLTGMDVANASMYDAATALSEALSVALAAKRKKAIVLPVTLNPRYRRVVKTMMAGEGITVIDAPVGPEGTTDPTALAEVMTDDVAACVIPNPNYLGLVEPVDELSRVIRDAGAIVVAAVNPVALSLLRTPAEFGAELAVGEAQPFGVPASWGGPLLGFLACTDKHKRRIPGRIVGRTADNRGNEGYVLTLQTREQHIRRDKATSNICSNQALNALRATVYLAMLGAGGLAELGEANLTRVTALRRRVSGIAGVGIPFGGPVFNETVIRLARPAAEFIAFARKRGVLAGIQLHGVADCGTGDLLVCVTEKRTAAEIENFGLLLEEFMSDATGGKEVSA
ncbi:MAG: aminomethyl-transferring glycine dehydrogenase subunit GcvPA [Candidatus Krumholzibacteria bacterium]|nr:aminomethyl-transferring glycine dehydrogenase subunit GcvPA [Candidatus Krumholzibacteria bacterium]